MTTTNRFVAPLLSIVMMTGAAWAQTLGKLPPDTTSSRPSTAASVKLEILEITKDDTRAEKDARGAGRLVPVNIRWKLEVPGLARVISLKAKLITKNTDGTKTEVKQELPIKEFSSVIKLPMPQNVFAKDFQLILILDITVLDEDKKNFKKVTEQAVKSGSFLSPRPVSGPKPR